MVLSADYFKSALEALDPWITNEVVRSHIPAFAIAAHTDDGTVFNRVYTGTGQVSSPDVGKAPLFAIGSSSKTITTAAIFKLAEQGRLQLNDRFLDFFPELDIPQESLLQHVTLLELTRHQSPLAAMERREWFWQGVDPEKLLRQLAKAKLNTQGKGRGQWHYSTLGFAMLGLVVERASKTSFKNYITQNILRPLGLSDILPSINTALETDRARILDGYDLNAAGRSVRIRLEDQKSFNASRGFVASVEATAHFYHLLLTGKVLSPHHTKVLHEAGIPLGSYRGVWRCNPGLHRGLLDNEDSSSFTLGHNGMTRGFGCSTAWHPLLNMTLSVMTNTVRLPVDQHHEFQGYAFPSPFAASVVKKLKSTVEEARQNKGFVEKMSPSSLAPLRRPMIPPQFNPEANPT